MSDFASWITEFSREALSGDNRALLILAIAAIVAGLAVTRKKFAAWLLLPLIAAAIWYGMIRWLQIRTG